MSSADDMQANLTNTITNLIAEKDKLRQEYIAGKISLEEYKQKLAENSIALEDARLKSEEYAR